GPVVVRLAREDDVLSVDVTSEFGSRPGPRAPGSGAGPAGIPEFAERIRIAIRMPRAAFLKAASRLSSWLIAVVIQFISRIPRASRFGEFNSKIRLIRPILEFQVTRNSGIPKPRFFARFDTPERTLLRLPRVDYDAFSRVYVPPFLVHQSANPYVLLAVFRDTPGGFRHGKAPSGEGAIPVF
ncbi:hypothetical protein ACTU45_24390, partial [Streptomyces sp. 24-1644]